MNRKYYLDEVWVPVVGYEGLFEISNYGRIKSLDYRKQGKEEIMHIHAMKGRCIKVGLRTGNKYRYFRVHRLVAQAFLPFPKEGQTCVEHIDGDLRNNYVNCEFINGNLYVYCSGTNLRWTYPKGKQAIRIE